MKTACSAAACVLLVASISDAGTVYFSVANRIYSGSGFDAANASSGTWDTTGVVPRWGLNTGRTGQALSGADGSADKIVALGHRRLANGVDAFYAVDRANNFHRVNGMGTDTITLDFLLNLANPGGGFVDSVANATATTESFDFINSGGGNSTVIGSFGSSVVRFDLSAADAAANVTVRAGLATSLPATARIGNQFYGMASDGQLSRINNYDSGTPSLTNIGGVLTSKFGAGVDGRNITLAGGSSDDGQTSNLFVIAAFNRTNPNGGDIARFGYLSTTTGAFTQLGADFGGNGQQWDISGGRGMGMVYVVPLPTGAAMCCAAGLSLVAVRRRRGV